MNFQRKLKDEKWENCNLIIRPTREETVKDFKISINDLSETLLNDQEGIRLLGVSRCLSVLAQWTAISLPGAFLSEGLWRYICYNLVVRGCRDISCTIPSHRSDPDLIYMLDKSRFVEEFAFFVSWIHNSTRVQTEWWPHIWIKGLCHWFSLFIAKAVAGMEMIYVCWHSEIMAFPII